MPALRNLIRAALSATTLLAATITPTGAAGQLPILAPGAATATEGDAPGVLVEVPITLSAASASPVYVDWITTDYEALAGSDYVATFGTVTIDPGDTVGYATISIVGDLIAEAGSETAAVTFSNPTNATLDLSFFGLGLFTIEDDDQPTLIPGGGSAPEGDSGTTLISVPVTLSAPSEATVSVDWTTFDTPCTPSYFGPVCLPPWARDDEDFVPQSGTVTFAPGDVAETIEIEVATDVFHEPVSRDAAEASLGGEYGLIYFSAPQNVVLDPTEGFYGTATFFIENDDHYTFFVGGDSTMAAIGAANGSYGFEGAQAGCGWTGVAGWPAPCWAPFFDLAEIDPSVDRIILAVSAWDALPVPTVSRYTTVHEYYAQSGLPIIWVAMADTPAFIFNDELNAAVTAELGCTLAPSSLRVADYVSDGIHYSPAGVATILQRFETHPDLSATSPYVCP